jgi:hypothetical protein
MNFGECPYDDCNEMLWIEIPDHSGKWFPMLCPKCHRKVWYFVSRIDPKAWTEADFLKKFTVNEFTKTIKAIA